ncbi:MAG: PQQ-binding-like beta-propeller repeat protein [Cyclobacteriaceae bacterium]|nr:PQQ-binding-like beta-propeller repeat protein [Cyclobacteriaceae bacterium]
MLAFILLLIVASCTKKSSEHVTWEVYSGDEKGTKYSALSQINTKNVAGLKVAWTYRMDDMRENPRTTIQCNPIIVGNRMFITSPGLKVIALDAASGKELWKFDPYNGESASGVNRGVTYWSDDLQQRLFYVAGSNLYCLNPMDGKPVLSFGKDGKVDLYEGLGRDVNFTWVTAATPGIIYKDLLILGSTLGEGPAAAAPGHIRAYDVKTGPNGLDFSYNSSPR